MGLSVKRRYQFQTQQGKLLAPQGYMEYNEYTRGFSIQKFEHYVRYILSLDIYKRNMHKTDFIKSMKSVYSEVLNYFDTTDPDSAELAGYFIAQFDNDFEEQLSNDDAFALAEWLCIAFYQFHVGDYTLLDEAAAQIELLNIWDSKQIHIVIRAHKQLWEADRNDQDCECDAVQQGQNAYNDDNGVEYSAESSYYYSYSEQQQNEVQDDVEDDLGDDELDKYEFV